MEVGDVCVDSRVGIEREREKYGQDRVASWDRKRREGERET